MKKLLITGFDPFGGQTVNPAWKSVRALPEHIGEYEIVKLEVPTVFGKAAQTVLEKAESLCPDVIVCVGQAGGRSKVTPEVVAINLRDASIADNAGNKPWNEPVNEGAPDALFPVPFPTLPVHSCATIFCIRFFTAIGVPLCAWALSMCRFFPSRQKTAFRRCRLTRLSKHCAL